jgi:hypothetical protein
MSTIIDSLPQVEAEQRKALDALKESKEQDKERFREEKKRPISFMQGPVLTVLVIGTTTLIFVMGIAIVQHFRINALIASQGQVFSHQVGSLSEGFKMRLDKSQSLTHMTSEEVLRLSNELGQEILRREKMLFDQGELIRLLEDRLENNYDRLSQRLRILEELERDRTDALVAPAEEDSFPYQVRT